MDAAHHLIRQAYAAFNACDLPALLALLHPQVRWLKTPGGDYATGHDEVRNFWQRQWQDFDTSDEPTEPLLVRPRCRPSAAKASYTATSKSAESILNQPISPGPRQGKAATSGAMFR